MSEQEKCPICGGAVQVVSVQGDTSRYGELTITTTTRTPDTNVTYVHVECPECAKLRRELAEARAENEYLRRDWHCRYCDTVEPKHHKPGCPARKE